MCFAVLSKKKIIRLLLIIVLGITALALLFGTFRAVGVFGGKSTRKLPIYRVQTEQKRLAISFDCAWGTDYTDKLIDTMNKYQVKCTFFAVEFWVNKHPDYVKKIVEQGHEFGTHSATHPYMSKIDKTAIKKELTTSVSAIESITGKKVEVFRPPYGDYNDTLIDTANELGLYTIQWDVDSLDWKDLSAKQITDRVLSRVKNGSIVLFHNQGLHTAEALPTIITELKKSGYEFVPVGELIYKDNFIMLPDGTQKQNS